MSDDPVTVKVSRELLDKMGDWSEPVEVMIERAHGEYTMVARRHSCVCPDCHWDEPQLT